MVSNTMHDSIYKIFTESEWKLFQESGQFEGSPDDLRDGFIHLCTREQVTGVIERFFAGKGRLYIAEFVDAGFLESIKWENTDSGESYPHLYGMNLLLSKVRGTVEI